MRDCWDTWKKTLAVIVVSILIGVGTWLSSQGSTITQTISGGNVVNQQGENNVHTVNITVKNGITLKEFADELKRRETEVRTELEHIHVKDRQVLELEFSDMKQKLHNITASYETHIVSINERITQLEQLRGEFPGALLDQAIEALQQSDSEKADRLFQKIGEEAEGHIKQAAVAAFQRGKIAEDNFRYRDALQFYEDNVRLQPDNADGWILLGSLYHRTGELTKAENAYNTLLKLVGNDYENEAKTYNGLGNVYQTRGDLDKAIELYGKALAINLELGSKKGIASVYGNLGIVYQIRGELDKAVEFWKQSLALFTEVGTVREIEQTQSFLDNVGQK